MADSFDPVPPDDGPIDGPAGNPIPMARPINVPSLSTAPACADNPLILHSPRRSAAFDLALVLVLILASEIVAEVLALVAVAISSGISPSDLDLEADAVARLITLPVLAFRAGGTMLILAAVARFRGQSAGSLGVTRRKWFMNGLIGVAATVTAYVLIYLWQFGVLLVYPELWDQMNENVDRLLGLLPKMHPLVLGSVAMVVAIYEELLFRGFLMTRLRHLTRSWWVAVILSTVIFVLPHALDQTVAALGPITILSLVFSAVTVWRRSLIPAIVAHFLFDYSQFLGLYFMLGDQWT